MIEPISFQDQADRPAQVGSPDSTRPRGLQHSRTEKERELIRTGPPLRQPDRYTLSEIRAEVDAISRRATATRRRLQRGEAVTGITGLIEIENHCRDALALLDTFPRS